MPVNWTVHQPEQDFGSVFHWPSREATEWAFPKEKGVENFSLSWPVYERDTYAQHCVWRPGRSSSVLCNSISSEAHTGQRNPSTFSLSKQRQVGNFTEITVGDWQRLKQVHYFVVLFVSLIISWISYKLALNHLPGINSPSFSNFFVPAAACHHVQSQWNQCPHEEQQVLPSLVASPLLQSCFAGLFIAACFP